MTLAKLDLPKKASLAPSSGKRDRDLLALAAPPLAVALQRAISRRRKLYQARGTDAWHSRCDLDQAKARVQP